MSGDDGIRQWAAIAYRPYQLAENVPYIPVRPWFKASTVRLEKAHLNQSQEKEVVEKQQSLLVHDAEGEIVEAKYAWTEDVLRLQ